MSSITTHVLDTAHGKPASGIGVALEFESGVEWIPIGRGITGEDGRCRDLVPAGVTLKTGIYRLRFDTLRHAPFYPRIEIMFRVENASEHFHIPLLLSPFGYSTYRGS
ncbi:MAG: hydroxyisourate hydrolase [Bryobacteraceae bacterium]